MPKSIADEPDALPTLIGEAIVAWSQIEATWAHIFFYLVYAGIGHPLDIDQETGLANDPHSSEKRRRAEAIFFGVPSSKTQRDMVVALAGVALANNSDVADALIRLAKKTERLGGSRNRIVHAYYDRPMSVRGTKIEYGPIGVSNLAKNQFTPADVARQIVEFKRFNDVMGQMLLAVVGVDDPPDTGEPAQRGKEKTGRRRKQGGKK